jgi:hypothetical protein
MPIDLPPVEVAAAIDRVVGELLDAAGVTEPPVDAIALAERHLGLPVRREPGARGVRRGRSGGTRALVLDPESSEYAQQWAAAQAVGAHLKPRLLQRLGLDADEARGLGGSSLTNRLAERLLVPTAWFAAETVARNHDLEALREGFRTAAPELIAARWLDLPEPCIITTFDGERPVRRRSNVWRVTKQPSPVEEQCRRAVAAAGRPRTVVRGGWTVQGWPVAEPLPRIVLRSVVDEDTLQGPGDD